MYIYVCVYTHTHTHTHTCMHSMAFPGGSAVKNPPASTGDTGDPGFIPGLGRSSGVGNGNLLQYSCLGSPMDGGAWWGTVQKFAKGRTQLNDLSTHRHGLYTHNLKTYVYPNVHCSSIYNRQDMKAKCPLTGE